MKLNDHLKQLRTSKNLSVYKLARMTDVSENHIRSIEKGNSHGKICIGKELDSFGLCGFCNNDFYILLNGSPGTIIL